MSSSPEEKRTYHLEMAERNQFRPHEAVRPELDVRQVEMACPELNWFMHQAVGVDFRWGGREDWDRQLWTDYADRPELETWIAYVGGSPAGYYELERQEDGSVRIECFGLMGRFIGQGLGGPLLSKAIDRCWEMGATGIWLTTCSHDHPHALRNYLERGFQVVQETTAPPNASRESVLFTSKTI